MTFSSLTFLFGFLPITLVVYYILGQRYRNFFLLSASLFFYAWGEPKIVFVMTASIGLNWLFAIGMYWNKNRRRLKKVFLILGLLWDIVLLVIFKYMNFITLNISRIDRNAAVTNIALPIGISFYTFQMISYLADVYRKPERNICKSVMNLGLYISFFPQLIAGPIVRYSSIYRQILHRKVSLEMVGAGAQRFVLGLAKKVIIANNLAVIADKAFGMDSGYISIGFAWLGVAAYTLQIYFDFSGYSDMAIGLGRMFGFHIGENFNYPYTAASITDFWRRWHISLSSWFRDYVYIPLGGDGRNFDKDGKTFFFGKVRGGGQNYPMGTTNMQSLYCLAADWYLARQ